MDKLFYISIAIVAILSTISNFYQHKFARRIKNGVIIAIFLCLGFQVFYGIREKKAADNKAVSDEMYQDRSIRNLADISRDVNELKELEEKKEKGLLTNNDYIRYVVLYLESIDRTLKFKDNVNVRSWITVYYEEVEKTPSFYNFQEWTNRELMINRSILGAINSDFSARGLYNSGMRTSVIESFQEERERLLNAKKREFQEASINKSK
jgi:hypothetical protein